MTEIFCSNCRFYHSLSEGRRDGQCRAKAPSSSAFNRKERGVYGEEWNVRITTHWPEVWEKDWCGHHRFSDEYLTKKGKDNKEWLS